MFKTTKSLTSNRNGTSAIRGIVLVNNYRVRFEEFSVEQNGFSAANSFEVKCPFFIQDTQNGEMVLANGPSFDSLLMENDDVPVKIYVGKPKDPANYTVNDLTLLMDGSMDTARWRFDSGGESVTLKGRNAVGRMLDTKITDKYQNLTSSAIAETFAAEHNLTPVVTQTNTLAGTWYNQNSALIGRDTTEWDLLLFLAKMENFIVRVTVDNKLLFGPYADVTSYEEASTIPYTWGYDLLNIELERSPHAAKNIIVKVISYSRTYNKKGTKFSEHHIEETASSTTERASSVKGQVGQRQKYTEIYTIPGLTREQARKKAQEILDKLSRSEILGTFSSAGNTALGIDKKITLNGVGKVLSQEYYLNRITHRFSLSGGYTNDCSFSNQYLSNTTGDDDFTTTESMVDS